MKNRFQNFLFAVLLFFTLAQTSRAAVGLTITPNTVSNTYSGKITLQVTGISSGGTVVIQKYIDLNTNGILDGADVLWQQFSLTDGAASVFHNGSTAVTNFNVPGDTDTTAGQITAVLNFQNGDFSQNIVGKYLYKVYSSSGTITNSLTVTNFSYAQSFTGSVFSNNTATVVSNAVILLFQPGSDGSMNPKGGVVANNGGSYTIQAPPGTYLLAAIRSNYLANLTTAPTLVLGSGSMITTNLTLTNATQSISGKFVDTNTPSLGIPGFLVPVQSTTNGFLAVAFTDTNGNFSVGTRPDQWKIESDDTGLIIRGYLAWQNNTKANTGAGSVSGVTISLPKATAIFYGSVKDSLGNPLAGIDVNASDDNGQYQSDGYTGTNGNYVVGASGTNWYVNVSTDSNPTNYVFSQSFDTALTNGQAQPVNFTAILATNHITGYVKDSSGNPISGVGVNANATISSVTYQTQVDTDSNGNYSLNVANGTWNVSVNCNGGNDSLSSFGNNYSCPNNQTVTNNNNNQVANFTVQSPPPDVISYYVDKEQDFYQTDASTVIPDTNYGPFNAYLGISQSALGSVPTANVTLPTSAGVGLPNGSTGIELQNRDQFADQPTFDSTYPAGNYTFNLFTLDNGNVFPVLNLPTPVYPSTPHISNYAAAQIINPNSDFSVQWDAYTGGTTNDNIWFIIVDSDGDQVFSTPTDDASSLKGTATSATIPAGTLQSGNDYSGTVIFFKVMSTNTTGYPGALGQALASTETSFNLSTISGQPLQITTTYLPTGTNGAFYSQTLQASGGTPPYSWSVPNYSANPPSNLALATNGVLSGTLSTTASTYYFDVVVTDAAANTAEEDALPLTIVNPPLPPLVITNISLPNGNVGATYSAQLGATGGLSPYTWALALGSANPPPGLGINSSGLISGMPTTNGLFSFKVQATDANSTVTNKVFGIIINPKPVLSLASWLTNQFKMRLTGGSNQNYTVQVSTNLSFNNWVSLFITNNTATNAFLLTDPNATNQQRFYRILIGP